MRTEKMEPRAGLELGEQLPFAYIRTLSAVSLGETPELPDLDELIEARFFDREQEIRIFRKNGSWTCCRIAGEPGDELLEKKFRLENREKFGEKLTMLYQLEHDEDGQTLISVGRLADWQKEERPHE